LLCAAIALAVFGCAQAPLNPPLKVFDPTAGYRLEGCRTAANSEELFVVVSLSGGGTRAAALAYAVMEQLRNTTIRIDGEERCLLEEVDVISAVSGGTFPAAYYALFGDEIFSQFEERFLNRDTERELLKRALAPHNVLRLASPAFGRSDLAAEYYDEVLFRGRTFGDLQRRDDAPFLIIGATDMSTGSLFRFTQDQFDLLYSDLSEVSVGRAAAASSAFPFLLTPMAFANYADRPGFREPAWIAQALANPDASPRRRKRALEARSYLQAEGRLYTHLLDGGLADNLALQPLLDLLTGANSSCDVPELVDLGKVKTIVTIVVNAQVRPDSEWDRDRATPGALSVLTASVGSPIANCTARSLEHLNEQAERFRRDGVAFHVVEIDFSRIEDSTWREALNRLPTRFRLGEEEVASVREAGAWLLQRSDGFRDLLRNWDGKLLPRPAGGPPLLLATR
jgi:predicted acylesterase/phospholipase RssA